ncbi:MAG: aldo/keto reductase [Nannocystaceae bacterium]|nr:aldo/keto reductase [Nannocystaceae bacterium]
MTAVTSTERLEGGATQEGTRRGAESFGAGARTLGRTGWSVTPIGFGGYRVRDESPVHRRALADALRGGVNLIDTSSNYGDGESERLVGRIVCNLVQQGEVRREQLVLVSKLGYLQGDNLRRAQSRAEPYPQLVEYGEQLWHCIHPSFIRDQLQESLQRLALSRLDVVLLHNPEYFLSDAARRGVALPEARAEFDARIRAAFVALEEAVTRGEIGAYGVSSNGFVLPATDPASVSVSRIVALAEEVAGSEHNMSVVQMPMNLLELAAVNDSPAPGEATPLQQAEAADLGVLVNRPLNALVATGGSGTGATRRLVRLASGGAAPDPGQRSLDTALAAARKLEARWATGLGQQLVIEAGEDVGDLFRWARELSARVDEMTSLQQWSALRHDVIAPHLGKTSSALLSALQGTDRESFAQWWEAYGTAMHTVFTAIEARISADRFAQADEITRRLDPLLPEPWRAMPLSAKAVLPLLGAPISAVLVGMRQPGYVADMLVLRATPVRLLSAAAGVVDLGAVAAALSNLP